jgi:hypothetical protein
LNGKNTCEIKQGSIGGVDVILRIQFKIKKYVTMKEPYYPSANDLPNY